MGKTGWVTPNLSSEIGGDLRERETFVQHVPPQQVQGDVFVAQAEPGVVAQPFAFVQHVERLVRPAPALLRMIDLGQVVEHGVDVGADEQAQVLEIVAGVDDDAEMIWRQELRQPMRQFRPAHAAC